MRIFQVLPVSIAIAFAVVPFIGCDSSTSPLDEAAVTIDQPQESVADQPVSSQDEIIPGRYIVVLRDGAELPAGHNATAKVSSRYAVKVDHLYTSAVRGFSAEMSTDALARLKRNPDVRMIEPDRRITLRVQGKPAKASRGSNSTPAQSTPWGVTRIGGSRSGVGKVAWIVDSGIDLDHPDLQVDVARSRNFAYGQTTPDDGNGHGTHVAGTIAAKDNTVGVVGVAAGATVVAVRVLDSYGVGNYSDIIAGVNYVAANVGQGDVVNMSLGGPAYWALDAAVTELAMKGVKVVVAAGNNGADASGYSPASNTSPNVYTVSSIGSGGCLSSWSNYGIPVDYAGPGENILSTWKGGGIATSSGTSMAAPHVAGILLLGPINTDGGICSDRDAVVDPIAHW